MAIRLKDENGKRTYEVYVNGFDSNGRRFQRKKSGIDTKKKAEQVEFEFLRQLALAKEKAVEYRWEEWRAICRKNMMSQYRPSTLENYEALLGKWVDHRLKGKDIQAISRSDVHDLIYGETVKNLTPWSKKTVLKMIKRIFQMAVEEGHIARNPCAGVKVSVPDVDGEVFTTKEAQFFLQEAKNVGHRFYPVWAMALMTGMRNGELFALSWKDVDFEARRLVVNKSWCKRYGVGPTKSQRSRVVPISSELEKFLKELRLSTGAEDHVLPRLWEWDQGAQAKITKDFCRSAGLKQIKFHDLRATFITHLLAKGISLARVMAIVGHSQIKTTNGYLRRAGIELQGATDDLSYKLPSAESAKVLNLFKAD